MLVMIKSFLLCAYQQIHTLWKVDLCIYSFYKSFVSVFLFVKCYSVMKLHYHHFIFAVPTATEVVPLWQSCIVKDLIMKFPDVYFLWYSERCCILRKIWRVTEKYTLLHFPEPRISSLSFLVVRIRDCILWMRDRFVSIFQHVWQYLLHGAFVSLFCYRFPYLCCCFMFLPCYLPFAVIMYHLWLLIFHSSS